MDFSFLCTDTAFTTEMVPGCFGSGRVESVLNLLVNAFGNTVLLSFTALILAIFFGVIIGTIRTLPNSTVLPFIAKVWIEFYRNIPLIVQLFLWYHVIPHLFPWTRDIMSPFQLAMTGLGLFTSARIAEQVRAGIESIPTGQRYAGMAMGFTVWQTYRFVLLPRAMRTIMPPLTSEAMGIVKNSGAAYAVGVVEMLAFAKNSIDITSQPEMTYFVVTVLYVLLALIIYLVIVFIDRKIRIPGMTQGGGA